MTDRIGDIKESEKQAMRIEVADEKTVVASDKDRSNPAWIPGLVLIGLGVIFLLNNLTDFHIDNWWALFILIPAVSALGNALRVYRNTGRLGEDGRGSLIGGLILMLVASTFLFSWNWAYIWPAFLVIGGIGLLLGALLD